MNRLIQLFVITVLVVGLLWLVLSEVMNWASVPKTPKVVVARDEMDETVLRLHAAYDYVILRLERRGEDGITEEVSYTCYPGESECRLKAEVRSTERIRSK